MPRNTNKTNSNNHYSNNNELSSEDLEILNEVINDSDLDQVLDEKSEQLAVVLKQELIRRSLSKLGGNFSKSSKSTNKFTQWLLEDSKPKQAMLPEFSSTTKNNYLETMEPIEVNATNE